MIRDPTVIPVLDILLDKGILLKLWERHELLCGDQCCGSGSGSGSDPDSIRSFDPDLDPDSESGSRSGSRGK